MTKVFNLTWGFLVKSISDLSGGCHFRTETRLYQERQEAYVGGRRWTAVAVLLVGQVHNRFMLLRVEKLGKVGVANFFTKFRGDFDVHIRRFPPPYLLQLQVRDGTRSHVTENIYKYIFKDGLVLRSPISRWNVQFAERDPPVVPRTCWFPRSHFTFLQSWSTPGQL